MAVGYYDQEFEPWARGIRSIGSAIVQAPMLRAAAQQRQQQAQLTQAQIGTEGAQRDQYASGARKNDAETQMLIKKGQLVTALQKSMGQAQQDLMAGATDTPAVREFSGAASALTGLNSDDIQENMKKGLGTLLATKGNVAGAAAVENPNAAYKTTEDNATRESIAAGANASREKIARSTPRTVSRDSGLWNPETQSWDVPKPERPTGNVNNLYDPATRQALVTLGEELARNYATGKTEEIAKTEAKIEAIKSRAKVATDLTPMPQRPLRKLGDAAAAPRAMQEQDPNDSEMPEDVTPEPAAARAAQPAGTPMADAAGKVRVISPDGKTGHIPKEQLDAALAQGYKLAQ